MKIALEKRIIFFSFIILLLTIIANTGLNIAAYRRDYISALIDGSHSLEKAFATNVEKVVGLGLDIRDIPGLTEKCREVVQTNTPKGDYCVVTDMEGRPLNLSDPSFAALRFNDIKKTFSTSSDRTVNIIGNGFRYYDVIAPIKSPDGKHLALIHVGFPEREISAKIQSLIIRSLLVLVFFFLLSFTLVVYFTKKSIMQPISTLLNGVKKIGAGSFDARIPELQVFEFNELGRNFNFMSESLQKRSEEIRTNYHELERAHKELHDSYSRLAKLSSELEKSEQLYKSFVEDASDAIIVIGDDEIVRMGNKMAEEFFAMPATRTVGLALTKMLQLIGTSDVPRAYEVFQRAYRGEHVDEEIQFERNGQPVVGRVHASCIRSGDERLVQAIIRDVTKEKEIMRNLEKSALDLVRLNRMKDSFLGLASHELKTPLTVIMGYTELILTDMADRVDKSVLSMLENISNAASRLDNIVKDMVDVSMIDQKRLQLKLEDIDVNRIVEMAVNELRFFFSMRKQEVVLLLDEDNPRIRGDSVRLMQMLSNVLGNAIKFTPDGGKITISIQLRHLMRSRQAVAGEESHMYVNIGRERHPYLELAIADTGIGIDFDDQLRIFDKFYEVGNIEEHSTDKVAFKGKGAGLGLAIAKGIVEMHGGEIWVESEGYDPTTLPGSAFHIILPLDPIVGDASIDYLNLLS